MSKAELDRAALGLPLRQADPDTFRHEPPVGEHLADLIARIEQADGPSREMDARICIALGLSRDNVMVGADGWCINSETNPNPHRSPAYTASLDSAMTLVPEGLEVLHLEGPTESVPVWDCDIRTSTTSPRASTGRAATPALALCAAALKAREVDHVG